MVAPRTILYTGKGGVGKTSVAAATARRCAAAGLRTLVVSTDPAHSLSDCMGTQLSAGPTSIGPNLSGQEVQAQEEIERHWQAVSGWLAQLLAEQGVDRISAEELTVPPGTNELFSLLQIKRHHESGEYDVLVVDCAPTGETLRLLSFPDVCTWWLEKVFPWQSNWLAAARPFARNVLDVPLPPDGVLADVERLVRNMVAMNAILRDPALTTVRLVMTPDRMVVREAMRTFTYLNLYGYLTDAVVVNRILPDAVGDTYFSEWREAQREQMEAVRSAFAPVPILTASHLPREVMGEAMLDGLGDEYHPPARDGGLRDERRPARERGPRGFLRAGNRWSPSPAHLLTDRSRVAPGPGGPAPGPRTTSAPLPTRNPATVVTARATGTGAHATVPRRHPRLGQAAPTSPRSSSCSTAYAARRPPSCRGASPR